MTHAIDAFSSQAVTASPEGTLSDKSIGLAIVAVASALFWSAVLYLTGAALGFAVGAAALSGFAIAIAGFLAVVVKALQAQAN